jgi:hypothetical protein
MRQLKIFDFDDTLAKSETPVIIKKADGSSITLTPAQFATYKMEPDDVLDFTYFNKMISKATPIKHNVELLKTYLSNPGRYKVTILTARRLAFPVQYWLKKLTGREVYVVGVAGSDPMLKANYIEKEIKKGYTDIFFMDDSLPNVQAIKDLNKKYPNVNIEAIVAENINERYLRQIIAITESVNEIESSNFIEEDENDAQKVLDDTPDDVEDALAKFLKMSPDELEKQVLKNPEGNKEVEESIGLTLLMAAPLLLELAGKLINKIKTSYALSPDDQKYYEGWKARKKAAKAAKDDAKLKALDKEYNARFASKFGKNLIGIGHDLHKAYTSPIVQVLKLASYLPGKFGDWAKDPAKRQKIANIIYACTMFFYGGAHAKHGLHELLAQSGVDPTTFADTIVNAAKSGKSLKDVVTIGLEATSGLETA